MSKIYKLLGIAITVEDLADRFASKKMTEVNFNIEKQEDIGYICYNILLETPIKKKKLQSYFAYFSLFTPSIFKTQGEMLAINYVSSAVDAFREKGIEPTINNTNADKYISEREEYFTIVSKEADIISRLLEK